MYNYLINVSMCLLHIFHLKFRLLGYDHFKLGYNLQPVMQQLKYIVGLIMYGIDLSFDADKGP